MARGGRNVNFTGSGAYRANYQAPKRQLHLARLWRPLTVFVAVTSLLYVVLFSPLFRVRAIGITGNKQLTSAELRAQTQTLLESTFLGSNSIFVNTNGLARQLKANNYQLEQVAVERTLLGGIRIRVVEQHPTLQWRSGSSVFVLSGNGRAYAQFDEVDKKLPLVEDSTNLPVKIGQKIVPSSFINFVNKVDTQLASMGQQSVNKSVAETTTELYVKTAKGFVIKFDTTRSLDSQMQDYRAVTAKGVAPKEYIDLRIAGKVFYK